MRVKRSLVVVGLVLTMSALAFAAFVQSFEFDTFDWTAVTRVPTLTNGIPSESGTRRG